MIFVAKLLNLGQVPKEKMSWEKSEMKMFMRSFQVNKQEKKKEKENCGMEHLR